MIHGLLHGIKRCLLRVTRGLAGRCRPRARRERGGFMGRSGIDLFIEDGARTGPAKLDIPRQRPTGMKDRNVGHRG